MNTSLAFGDSWRGEQPAIEGRSMVVEPYEGEANDEDVE
jgi:hypothetical protein